MKKLDLKKLHKIIIVIGSIFVLLSVFHVNTWFDESYSVGMANYSLVDIWKIGSNDVHPVFYYLVLHLLSLIFGSHVIVYRLFSAFLVILLGFVGYSHVRKDFGDNVGFWFSFLVFFLPVNLVYAGEIRMYSLVSLLVTLTAIYGYRIYKNENRVKNFLLFFLFSLSGAYTHYYGLLANVLINGVLFILLLKDSIKERKLTFKLKGFIVAGCLQIILYLPWVMTLLLQVKQVKNSFWIEFKFPQSYIELFNFFWSGNLSGSEFINAYVVLVFGMIALGLIGYFLWQNRKKINKCILIVLFILFSLVFWPRVISLMLKRVILYARYLYCGVGLFIFFVAYFMANNKNKVVNKGLLLVICLFAVIVNYKLINDNYDKDNYNALNFIKENITDKDIILVGNDVSALAMVVHYPNNVSYFYDYDNWNVEKAYQAFGKNFKVEYNIDFLKNYNGKIFIIGSDNIYNIVNDTYDIKTVKKEYFEMKYHNTRYNIYVLEK